MNQISSITADLNITTTQNDLNQRRFNRQKGWRKRFKSFHSLRLPSVRLPLILKKHNNNQSTMLQHIRDSRKLHKRIPHEGYPLRRSLWNELGGGLVAGALTGTAIPIAKISAWAVGFAGYTTRSLELILSVVLNQREATKRCNARRAVEENNTEHKRNIKKESAEQLLSRVGNWLRLAYPAAPRRFRA